MPRPNRRFVNISHKHKLVYYLIARTASTSIRHAIGCSAKPSNASRRTVRNLPEPYFSFTVVRNPWDRLVSVWAYARDKVGQKPIVIGRLFRDMGLPWRCSFRKFAIRACEIPDRDANLHYRSQRLFIPSIIDMVMRFENIGDDWQRLQEQKPELPDLEWHETSDHEYFAIYYTKELRDMVGKRYQGDLDLFGWKPPELAT